MIAAYLGQTFLLCALASAIAGLVTSSVGAFRHSATLMVWGRRCTVALVASSAAASVTLAQALVRHDYTLEYVAGRVSNDLPKGFSVTAFWAGQEGSLLLWLMVLSTYTIVLQRTTARRLGAEHAAFANAVLLTVAGFFATLVAFVSRPFIVADTLVTDGAGLVPALRNYWMAIHPPALYIGFVGMAVPFALVVGALMTRRQDDAWIEATRRWTLLAWIGLTCGLALGARWAYEEIGWGGYWAWDPVENAALMPWLVTTAFVHSIMVQQRRGMMRLWNPVLASIAFSLSIFGTFLTRSGILSSVHSFVESAIGWWFLGFLAVVCFGAILLIGRSREHLRATHDVDTVVSRETAFLFNNLLLVALTFAILWGILFPIVTNAVAGIRLSLQAPYDNFFAMAFGLPLLVLVAVGPLIPWRRASLSIVARRARPSFACGVVAGALFVAFAHGSRSWPGAAAISLGVFVVASSVLELISGARAQRTAHDGLTRMRAFGRSATRNRRRLGSQIAHTGLGLLAIGIAGSSAYVTTSHHIVRPGDTIAAGSRYVLHYTKATRQRSGGLMQTRAVFDVTRGGRHVGTLSAGKDFHPASGEVSNEVGIKPNPFRGEDLFVIVDRLREDGRATIKVLINPLVELIWLAALFLVAGGLTSAWPSRRERGGIVLGARIERANTPKMPPATQVEEPLSVG
jgi:cytochrome c-type biogenesis protein CcmF